MSDKFILVVEDSPDDEELTMMALRDIGLADSVRIARDGESAIAELARTPASSIRFVLLDLKMPKVDGFGVLQSIRGNAATRMLPVVVFSSSDSPEEVERAYQLGANSFVSKAPNADEFTAAVRQAGQFWFAVNKTT